MKAPAVAPSIPRAPSIPGSASIPQNASAHLIASVGPSPDEVNRRVLETRAGEEGSKLLMRSIPNRAQIYLNKEFVGHTPLLLIVPPGKYRIEMRGQREENAEKTVGLLAHETREVTMKLPELYPTRITLK
ncbi:MAG: PEGA domain-containing protein [Candidatus Acidiferrales bacterium]